MADFLSSADPNDLLNTIKQMQADIEELKLRPVSFGGASEAMDNIDDLDYRAKDADGKDRLIMSGTNLQDRYGINAHLAGFNKYEKPQFYFSADDGAGMVADGLMKMNIDGITYGVDGVFLQAGTEPDAGYAIREVQDGGTRMVQDGSDRIVFDSLTTWNWTMFGTVYFNEFTDNGTLRYFFGTHGFTLSGDMFFKAGQFENGVIERFSAVGTPTIIDGDSPSGQYSCSVDAGNYIYKSIPTAAGQYYLLTLKVKSLGTARCRINVTNGGIWQIDMPFIGEKWIKYPVLIKASGTPVTIQIKSAASGQAVLIDEIKLFKVYGYSSSASLRDEGLFNLSQARVTTFNGGDDRQSAYEISSATITLNTVRTVNNQVGGRGLINFRINGYRADRTHRAYSPRITVDNVTETTVADPGALGQGAYSFIPGFPLPFPTDVLNKAMMYDKYEMELLCRASLTAASARTITFKIYDSSTLLATAPVVNIPAVIGDYAVIFKVSVGWNDKNRKQLIFFFENNMDITPKFITVAASQFIYPKITATLSLATSFSLISEQFQSRFVLND